MYILKTKILPRISIKVDIADMNFDTNFNIFPIPRDLTLLIFTSKIISAISMLMLIFDIILAFESLSFIASLNEFFLNIYNVLILFIKINR